MTSSVLNAAEQPFIVGQWHKASWRDYLEYRDRLDPDQYRLFFHQGNLLIVEMGWEGIDHAALSDLFIIIFGFWFGLHSEQTASSLGRCLLEKETDQSGAPDLVLYLGDDYPQWRSGEPRRIDLNKWRAPDLVGEISDTSLPTDLDEKKQLYAALGIAEYWVVDVRGQRIFAFSLQPEGKYKVCEQSQVLASLPISLLEETIRQLGKGSNISAAAWFNQQVSKLNL
ncbi:MAG: Uma2 family endonuclease [Leptolyngbyaceae cyanobacterium MO_188.B28]|nr:Uma2 family endonuclease [Leptolyngbyaceae cyanobacterium MO_188.B28]